MTLVSHCTVLSGPDGTTKGMILCSKAVCQNLELVHLIKGFFALYRIQRFMTVYTTAPPLTPLAPMQSRMYGARTRPTCLTSKRVR
jgi:hypothetical protein